MIELRHIKTDISMTSQKTPLTLDIAGKIPIHIEENQGRLTLSMDMASLDSSSIAADRLIKNLSRMAGLQIDGKTLADTTAHYDAKTNTLVVSAAAQVPEGAKVTLSMTRPNKSGAMETEPVVTAMRDSDGTFLLDEAHQFERLNVTEIKPLSNADSLLANIPYSRALLQGYNPQKHAPITELHTHFSAQISARAFMDIALKHDRARTEGQEITYPVELLTKLGIGLNDAQQNQVVKVKSTGGPSGMPEADLLQCERKGVECDAIRLSNLTQAQRDSICRKMEIAPETILQFSQFDPEMYRYRSPLSKSSSLNHDFIMEIAKEYARHGVKYAELSLTTMLRDPDWFVTMERAVDEAKQTYGVDIRFLAAVPRSAKPADLFKDMERMKCALRHPYVVGMDIVGYEVNATDNFRWALEHMASWAAHPQAGFHKNDMVIRVHAGETGKRHDNVIKAVEVAEKYKVPFRIAHALNAGLTAQEEKRMHVLSAQKLLALELCPPSNLAYNNIVRAEEVPFERFGKIADTYIATDGAGTFGSDAHQIGLDALYAGWTLKDLETMRENETKFIARAHTRDERKRAEFEKHYGTDNRVAAFVADYKKKMQEIDTASLKAFAKHRVPLLIVGAAGESYKKVQKTHAVEVALEMLALAMDREKSFGILGRVKPEGVSKVFDNSISAINGENPNSRLDLAAIVTDETTEVASSVSHVEAIAHNLSNIAKQIFVTSENLTQKAFAIFIGGSSFTGDILQYYHGGNLPFALMNTAEGASKDRAEFIDASKHFSDGISLLQTIDRQTAQNPERFGGIRPFIDALYKTTEQGKELDEHALQALYEQAEKRVMSRQRLEKIASGNGKSAVKRG